mgnify:CR=1 FL=1
MKRRDILRITALSISGMSMAAEKSFSGEKAKRRDDPLPAKDGLAAEYKVDD